MNNFLKVHSDPNRIYGLDILRALAILFVVIQHGNYLVPEKFQALSSYLVFDGVSMFFVLSGFLIGGILIKTLEKNEATPKTLFDFWVRRWFRTLPNYYMILFLLMLVVPFLLSGSLLNPFKKLEYVFFIQNINKPHPLFFQEAWSLSVEELFYMIIPLFIFFLVGITKTSVPKAIIISAALVIATSLIFRYIKFSTIPINSYDDWNLNLRKQVITRLDSNMFGLLGALVAYYYRETWTKYKNILFVTGIIMLVAHKFMSTRAEFGMYSCVFSFSLVSLGVLFTLPFLSEYKKGEGFVFRFLTFISIISYSLYLLNLSLFNELGLNLLDHLGLTGKTLVVVRYTWFWVFSLAGSFLLYKFFEKPMLGLRERFSNS